MICCHPILTFSYRNLVRKEIKERNSLPFMARKGGEIMELFFSLHHTLSKLYHNHILSLFYIATIKSLILLFRSEEVYAIELCFL